MKLSISICATASYLHVWKTVIRRIVAASLHRDDVHIVYVSDETDECKKAFALLEKECPAEWSKEHRPLALDNTGEHYKLNQQILIAKMHGEGFTAARMAGAKQCWTVEADVLVPPDSLRMMEWALQMPQADGSPYYDVAMCTYSNGLFIGGRGDPTHPIAEDFKPEERVLTDEIKGRYEAHKVEEKAWIEQKKIPDEEWQKKAQALAEDIKKCPPMGNVWEMNAKFGWRLRGWMDFAYPGIGRGAIVPGDWVGEGCNLLSEKALAVANFEGYDGRGTQDLFLCWRRYHPNNLRMACITHTICDHVKKQGNKIIHYQALHEQMGESKGHLRVVQKDWVEV